MAKDIEIEVKVGGLSELKRGLKEAKDELIALQSSDVIDPDKIRAAEARAGQLRDTLNDVNERIAVMSGGSDFEKVSNGLGLIGDQLSNMDFEGAAQSAKLLTSTIKGMSPETVAAGFKDMIGTVAQLGKAFMTMGMQLIEHPLFLLVAVVVAIVAAIILLKDKLVIAQKAFDLMMMPINLLIDGLKTLTDWMGLTAFAAEESAERQIAATNRQLESSKKYMSHTEAAYARKIALMKAEGKDVEEAEIQLNKIRQAESYKNIKSTEKSIAELEAIRKGGKQKLSKEQEDTLDKLKTTLDEETQSNLNAQNEIKVIKATSATEANKEAEKKREENLKNTTTNNKKIEQELNNHKKALEAIELKYKDDIESLGDKTEEDRLETQKKREQRELNSIKLSTDDKKKAQLLLDEKYKILEEQLLRDKEQRILDITNEFDNKKKDLIAKTDEEKLNRQLEIDAKEEEDIIAKLEKEGANAERIKEVKDYYDLLETDRRKLYNDNLLLEEEELNKQRIELEEKYKQAKMDALDTGLNILMQFAGKNKAIALGILAIQKGLAIADVIVGAGKSIALAQANLAAVPAVIGVAPNPMYAVQAAATLKGIATTKITAATSIASILASGISGAKSITGGGASGGGAGGAGGGASAPVQPSFNLVGGANRGNEATSTKTVENNVNNNTQPIMVTAVVSETQVTDTQNRVRRIQDNAEL